MPDWFYVPNVPPLLNGQIRRSYVLWREYITPVIALEFTSGDGSEERDTTPLSRSAARESGKPGKFWTYEQVMRIPYYGIYQISQGVLEVYHLVDTTYQLMQPNQRNHYPIAPLQVELGVWQGNFLNQPEQSWLRWWNLNGDLLLTGREQAEQEILKRQQLVQQLSTLSPEQLASLGIELDWLELENSE